MILRGERQEGMSICALPEVANALRTICSLTLGPKENAVLDGPLRIEAVRDGETRFLAGRECTFFDIHSVKAPQFGFSALLEGEKRFVCMGDEPVDARCSRYALGADWLAAEAYCLDSMRDVFHPEKIRHSTVKETAEQAERFGVRNLILWHTEDRATFGQRRGTVYGRSRTALFRECVLYPTIWSISPSVKELLNHMRHRRLPDAHVVP